MSDPEIEAEYEAAKAAYLAAQRRLSAAKAAREAVQEASWVEKNALRERAMAAGLRARLAGQSEKAAAAAMGNKDASSYQAAEWRCFYKFTSEAERKAVGDWVMDRKARLALIALTLKRYAEQTAADTSK